LQTEFFCTLRKQCRCRKIKTDGSTEEQKSVAPPNVPAPVGDRAAKKVVVRLETIEKQEN
jgi:hypothetical protein